MRRIRIITIFVIIPLVISLVVSLINNPLFLSDVWRSVQDVQLELTLTGLLVVILFWVGIEVNNRITRGSTMSSPSPREIPGSGLLPAAHRTPTQAEFWQGISTEMIGAVITTILLGMIILIFQEYQNIQNRKEELTLQLASPNNEFASEAVRQLAAEGWLTDGSLRGAQLQEANLMGVDMEHAVLSEANLRNADLSFAYMKAANLAGADLLGANLAGIDLWEADLTEARLPNTLLIGANLYGAEFFGSYLPLADLSGADLRNTNFLGANMREANLNGARLYGSTLPDGTEWTETTDVGRFTTRSHPHYLVTVEQINRWRFEQGMDLIATTDNPIGVLPIMVEQLDLETLRERINIHRAVLGLEPLE